MGTRSRRKHSAALKAKVALESVHLSQIADRKRLLLEPAAQVFG